MTDVQRSSFVVIAELPLLAVPEFKGWNPGPLPLTWQHGANQPTIRLDADQRQQYFSPRVNQRLYPDHKRFWKDCSSDDDRVSELRFIEVLLVSKEFQAGPRLFVMLHGSGSSQPLFSLMAEVRLWSEELSNIVSHELGADFISAESERSIRKFTEIFGVMNDSRMSVFGSEHEWPTSMQNAWVLAQKWLGTRATSPTASHLRRISDAGGVIEASNEVSVVIAQDGAGVVAIGSGFGDDPFLNWANGQPPTSASVGGYTQLLVHTIYADCFLMGLQQSSGLNEIADRFGAISGKAPRLSDLRSLERWFAVFKSEVWWHQITELSEANEFLGSFQKHHDLDDLMDEVSRDLGYLSDQIQTQNTVISSVAISFLTLILFPLTITIAAIGAIVPNQWNAYEKVLAYLASVPVSLLIGIGIAACIPQFGKFVIDVFRRGDE